ncbi:MAG: signal peptidase II [Eubacteriaceae bacterium]|nr:signal peptidase II [Eubacteriaceae bacterium]
MNIMTIIAIVFIDFMSKFAAVRLLEGMQPIVIIKRVISLEYVENTGAAFGILKGKSYYLGWFSIALCAAMLIFMLIVKSKNPRKKIFVNSIAMIIGGALANGIERLYHEYVIDFFKLTFINFPVFNMADVFITVGTFLFCLNLLFDRKIKL